MKSEDLIQVVKNFNNAINTADIKLLFSLMTDDHTFIDSANTKVQGKQVMTEGWQSFFKSFPDYCNHFESFFIRNNFVVIAGFSTCSEPLLIGKWLWSAKIEEGLIAEWRVYKDNEENRTELKLDSNNNE